MPIFRRKNCIHTASGIVALCKRLHSTPVESGLLCSPLSTGVCRQTPTTHIISTFEPLYEISVKYKLSLAVDGSYVIRNMLE